MALKANYDFLFIGKDDNSYLENYSYDEYDKLGEKSGEIFINLEIQNNPANSEEIGEAVFSVFQEEFFNRFEEEPYARFENSLKAVNAVLSDFKGQKVSGYIGNLNIVIAALVGNILYVTQSGDAEAYLVRKKFVSVITEGLYDEGNENVFSNIANGDLEEGDKVLISSTRLLRYISKTDLGRILSNSDPAQALAELKDVVSTEMLGKVGLTAIGFKEVHSLIPEGAQVAAGAGNEFQNTLLDTSSSAERVVSTPGGMRTQSTFSKVLVKVGGVAKSAFSGAFSAILKKSRERQVLSRARSSREVRSRVSGVGAGIGTKIGAGISSFKNGLLRSGFGGGKVLLTLVVVLVVLIGGVWIVYDRNAKQAEIQALSNKLVDVQNKISEAETKGQYDKEAAGQILGKAQVDALEVLNSGQYREKASILLKQIEDTKDALDNVKRISTPTLLADLTEKRSNISALGFVSMNDRLFVFEYNALYELVVDQVQDPVTLDDEETVIAATDFDDRSSLVFLTKSGKLLEYKEGAVSFMDTDEGAFHKGVALEDWSNKIYVLDPDNNQLWKYTYKATSDTFSVAAQYTTTGDFALAKDFAIDSNIWFMMPDGIQKYYGGVKEDLIISKAPFNAFVNPVKVITDEKMSQVFVLDSDGRILAFYKDENTGNLIYSNQYVVEGIGEIRDFFVDLNANRIKVLTPTAVYEFDM
ncbi:MAG: hypothetical protein WC604_03625 [Candidatus Gracilibacteria bacterium]